MHGLALAFKLIVSRLLFIHKYVKIVCANFYILDNCVMSRMRCSNTQLMTHYGLLLKAKRADIKYRCIA